MRDLISLRRLVNRFIHRIASSFDLAFPLPSAIQQKMKRVNGPDLSVNNSFEERSELHVSIVQDSVHSQGDYRVASQTLGKGASGSQASLVEEAPQSPGRRMNMGPLSIRTSNKSLAGGLMSNGSETTSHRGSSRRSPRVKRFDRQETLKQKQPRKERDHLEIIFKAISERPHLDNMSREERIHEKLKFFNLEKETLQDSRKRVSQKVAFTGTRFGPRESNLAKRKDIEGGSFYNPFEEMMAIEAEFGSIFESQEEQRLEQARNQSHWFPLFQTIAKKNRVEQFKELVKNAEKHKEESLQARQLELLKQQIARGAKNIKTDALLADDNSEGMDVSKMIAEEQQRAQNQRMVEMVNGIYLLNEKSIIEDRNIEGIKEFIKYKYPKLPSVDQKGDALYEEIISKVDSQWQWGELDEMKSRSKSRFGSPKSRTFARNKSKQESINVQDFKHRTGGLRATIYGEDSDISPADPKPATLISLNTTRAKTGEHYVYGQGQGGQNELVDFEGLKSLQPSVQERNHSMRPAKDNFDLFAKNLSKESGSRKMVPPTSLRLVQPQHTGATSNFLPPDDSFYISIDQMSPVGREKRPRLPKLCAPMSDQVWKEHQVIKQVRDVDSLNTYAGELYTEMRIYALNRLENVRDNIAAIVRRLKQLKPKKRGPKKAKKKPLVHCDEAGEEQVAAPVMNSDVVIAPTESVTDPQVEQKDGHQEKAQSDKTPNRDEPDKQVDKDDSGVKESSQTKQCEGDESQNASPDHRETPSSEVVRLPRAEEILNPTQTQAQSFGAKSEELLPAEDPSPANLTPDAQEVQEAQPPAAASLVLKTVNDREFDTRLISRFNKNDYKKTKVCLESLKLVLLALESDDLISFDFDWTSYFQYSIFWEELQAEIVPIVLVLKKFARTDLGNCSLRAVLARKLVNFKVQFGVIDPSEMPTVSENADIEAAAQLMQMQEDGNDVALNSNLNEGLDVEDPSVPQQNPDGLALNQEAGCQAYQDSLYKEARDHNKSQPPESSNQTPNAKQLSSPNPFSYQMKRNGYDKNSNLNFVPVPTSPQATPSHSSLPNRVKTASNGARKFATKDQIAQREANNATLPRLTGSVGHQTQTITEQVDLIAPRTTTNAQDSMMIGARTQQRLIKTSHVKHRRDMVAGEIDDGSHFPTQQQQASNDASNSFLMQDATTRPLSPEPRLNQSMGKMLQRIKGRTMRKKLDVLPSQAADGNARRKEMAMRLYGATDSETPTGSVWSPQMPKKLVWSRDFVNTVYTTPTALSQRGAQGSKHNIRSVSLVGGPDLKTVAQTSKRLQRSRQRTQQASSPQQTGSKPSQSFPKMPKKANGELLMQQILAKRLLMRTERRQQPQAHQTKQLAAEITYAQPKQQMLKTTSSRNSSMSRRNIAGTFDSKRNSSRVGAQRGNRHLQMAEGASKDQRVQDHLMLVSQAKHPDAPQPAPRID